MVQHRTHMSVQCKIVRLKVQFIGIYVDFLEMDLVCLVLFFNTFRLKRFLEALLIAEDNLEMDLTDTFDTVVAGSNDKRDTSSLTDKPSTSGASGVSARIVFFSI